VKQVSILFFALIALSLFNGCISYYDISAPQLAEQMRNGQKPETQAQYVPVAPLFLSNRYEANNIEKLLCTDSKGDTVWFYPNQNTELEITMKSGDEITMYFDTVILEGTKLKGLRSRLLHLEREVELTDIQKIQIYAEGGKTERVGTK